MRAFNENITVIDWLAAHLYLSRINGLIKIIRLEKNWYDSFMFRIGIKKPIFTIYFRDGKALS